ncbi:unnamed protein product [Rhizoctonia solani]|uniref:Diacetyl reductase [(S)-acetoin forming] n=1 Tax=Rhizoctonia solani TaxID=456999 RepID=A0A8H3DEW6_9AGAM|nr:unnamed protein product [Rhizoctonia solani]
MTGFFPGLGKTIALRLASDGYSIVISDLASKKNELATVLQQITKIYQSHSHKATPAALQIECDVTSEDQVNNLIDTTVKQLGRLDVMIANAGIVKLAPLLELTGETIDLIHDVNVKGLFYCYRAAAKAMISTGGGRIIGACSVAGKLGLPSLGAYCMSKSAVRSLTHTAAQEWAEYGITVNAYAPGAINTNMWLQDVVASNAVGPALDQKADEVAATRKKSTPEQVAGLVSFLVSPAADNITGQCISIDGGWNMD